jgi:lysophospholipase L1-like esterase
MFYPFFTLDFYQTSNLMHPLNWLSGPLLLLFWLLPGWDSQAQTRPDIGFDDKRIRYEGRLSLEEDAAMLSWSGNSAEIAFIGSNLKVLLRDEGADNYFQVIIDGISVEKIRPDSLTQWYTLAKNLPWGRHTVQLVKLTEWRNGKTWFYGVALEEGARLLPAKSKKRKMEFYGDSITCGYAVEDSVADSGESLYQNNSLSYAALTARHFGAAYSCIAKSGIGLMVSWQPDIMPELYRRQDPTDSASRWNFANYRPDVVVINLLQNDAWLINRPDHPEFIRRFGSSPPSEAQIVAAYSQFVGAIRTEYPRAHIICVLGNMDATQKGSPWPAYISKAVAARQDPRIHTLFFPYKQTPGHPKVEEQQAMARELIRFIAEKTGW